MTHGIRQLGATERIDWKHRTAQSLRKAAEAFSDDYWSQAGLALLWCVSVIVVGAWDEFPINDDWAYSLPIIALEETATVQLSHWQSMPLLPQLVWGGLISELFGASPAALRFSTQILALVAVLCLFRLMRDRGASPPLAFLGGAILLANPLFVASSNTFMTDVPFVALLLLSVHWFLRAVADGSALNIGVAFLFALLATLVRQLGVAVAIAFCVVAVAKWGFGQRWLVRALAPTVLLLGSLPAFRQLLKVTVGLPALYDERNRGFSQALQDLLSLQLGVLRAPLERVWVSLGLLGVSLLPLSVIVIASMSQTPSRALWGIVLAAAAGVGLLSTGRIVLPEFEYEGSLLVGASVGPMTLPGPLPKGTPLWLEQALSGVAAAGAGLLLFSKWSLVRTRAGALQLFKDPSWALPVLTLLLALGPLLIAYGPFFDRYLLFAVPLWIVACIRPAMEMSRGPLIGALALVAVLFAFSTAATRDLFSWNRVRWSVASAFISETPREQLDGGFEFNNFVENVAELQSSDRLALTTISRASAPFAIQFQALDDQSVVNRFPVDTWLPTSPQELVLVTRK